MKGKKRITMRGRLKRMANGIIDRVMDFIEFIILTSIKGVCLALCFFIIVRFMGFIDNVYYTRLKKDRQTMEGALMKCIERKGN